MANELDIMSYAEAIKLRRDPVRPNVYLTGHHIIPDHCFYIASGGRAAQVDEMRVMGTASYTTGGAPVIMLTADINGGKTEKHGEVHAIFDAIEKEHCDRANNTWTYQSVRDLAIKSIVDVFPTCTTEALRNGLNNHFITALGFVQNQILRCGEHSSLVGTQHQIQPRRSARGASTASPMDTD